MKHKEQFMNEFNNRYFFDKRGDVTKAKELTNSVQKLLVEGDFHTVSYAASIHQVIRSSSSIDFMPSQSAGIAFNQIMEALLKNDVSTIGLYGMGGIGKTTLAEQVQKEVERTKIFDHTIMVTLSQRPDLRRIQGKIADILKLKLEQETEEGRASKLKQRFKDEKILVILDDIWKPFDLRTIGITLNECKGCKTLLTTRRKKVCNDMDCQTNIQLNLLSEDEAREFFKKKARLSEELKLDTMAEEIVAECKGLPIALATVGVALRNKGEDEWREARDKLRYSRLVDIVGVDNDEINAYKCLRLSYDYLTHSAEAQEAQFILLLCSLHPEDYDIKVEALSRYVFGMRLFHGVKSIEDARRKVRVGIGFLKESCLLLDGYRENIVTMHDVVRDVILWIGVTESREKNVLTVRDESDLKEFLRNDSFKKCRAVSFMAKSVPVLAKYNQLVCPNLETILVFGGKHEIVELSNEFFEHMEFLKVLDLKRIKCRFGIPQSLSNLTDLRALMLEDCVCSNSSILRGLRNLEILSMEECEIDCKAEVVSGLKELRLMDLVEMKAEGMYPSNMIETLSKLEELHGHIIRKCEVGEGRNSGSSSFEWKLLSNLSALSVIIEDASCIPMGFCFPNLATYFIRIGGTLDNDLCWSPASKSRCLDLRGIEDESAMMNVCKKLLPTVLDLRLEGWKDLCSLTVFASHTEGLFQRLETLEIMECNKMERVFEFEEEEKYSNNTNSILQLQLLKTLNLFYLPELKHIWKGPTRSVCLRNLSKISIWNCSKLESLLIECCNNLEEIISRRGGSDDDFISGCTDNIQGVSHDLSQNTTVCFSSLTFVRLKKCNKLKQMFTTSIVTNLHHLGMLIIESCSQLEHVFSKVEDGKDPIVGIRFENLRSLKVRECGKLKTIFPISTAFPKLISLQLEHNAKLEHVFAQLDSDCIWQYPLLENISLVGCPKLCTQFSATVIKSLSTTKAKYITLGDIKGVEEFVQTERQMDTDVDELITRYWEKLSLQNLEDLKRIWRSPTQNVCLASLFRLEVIGCNKLNHLFDTTIAITLSQLTELIVWRCNELEQVIIMAENGKELTTGVVFENMRTLDVRDCGKLKTIFPISTVLSKLKRLRIERNPKLEHAFGQSDKNCTWKYPFLEDLCLVGSPKICAQFVVICLQNLSTMKHIKKIELGYIQGVEDLIQLQSQNVNEDCDNQFDGCDDADSDSLFPSLETLSLRNIVELKCIWHRPVQNICFTNLSEIKVIGCNRLKHIFATVIARKLPNLKKLIVKRCNELEHVITDDDGKEEWDNVEKTGPISKVGFESLEVLYVSNCEKLKTIFLPLPKLDCLPLENNAQLESLFGQSDCDCTSTLTHLKMLSITDCPKLSEQFVDMIKSRLQAQTSKQLGIINLSSIQGVEELIQFHRQDDDSVVGRQCLKLEEVGDLKRIWSGLTHNTNFSSLAQLRVIGCSKLKQLFTTTMATSLHYLTLLSVERCHDLQQVIEEGSEENNTQSVLQLKFSGLHILRLIDLPKLISFCPTPCNLLLPCLAEKNLKVEVCPEPITEFFSQQRYRPDNKMKYLVEFDDGKDEDNDDSDNCYYPSIKYNRKLFGYRIVEDV